jgi:EAL domain-containing protein (putative c-di-GMP-specific phosphodiesterase class I)
MSVPAPDFPAPERLRLAIENHEFALVYQPQVELREEFRADGTAPRTVPIRYEGFLRWNVPGADPLLPARFLRAAEKHRLMGAIGRWSRRQACAEAASWRKKGVAAGVAVNLSAQEITAEFPASIAETLEAARLEPTALCLELSASTLLRDDDATRGVLNTLREWGIHLAVDNFGTGYSSLSYLKQFPVDIVKIAPEFIAHIATNPPCAEMVRAILSLGQAQGMEVIACGVETEAQRDALRRLGCTRMQGYLFGMPGPVL